MEGGDGGFIGDCSIHKSDAILVALGLDGDKWGMGSDHRAASCKASYDDGKM